MPRLQVPPVLLPMGLCLALTTPAAGQPASAPVRSPAVIAQQVQRHYEQARDLEAEFVQTYQGGLLRQTASERGTVAIRRPGRMRWTYTAPERKEFVADGEAMYSYVPQDRQVIVMPMPGPHDTTPALFLSGLGHLVDDFTATATELPGAAPDLLTIRLTPKVTDRDIEWIAIAVDPATFQIRHLSALDRQGGTSTFVFSRIREDRRLPDAVYRFVIPRGAEVIRHAAAR